MKRRLDPDPDPGELAERRAEVARLLADARRHATHRPDWPYWDEAVTRLEALAADPDPDLAEAKAAWRFGRHLTDSQAGR